VEPRCEELLGLVRDHIRRAGLEGVAGGVVLTGGSARMEGLVEMGEEVFDMPVRLGHPNSVTGLGDVIRNPVYATAVGLLTLDHEAHNHRPNSEANGLRGVFGRMRGWIQGVH
jgi:cell division protein FtsA